MQVRPGKKPLRGCKKKQPKNWAGGFLFQQNDPRIEWFKKHIMCLNGVLQKQT